MKESSWVSINLKIIASPQRVLKVLIDPFLTQHYMFNCQLHCRWEVGSEAFWKEVNEYGEFTTHVQGELLEYKPEEYLRFLIFHKANELKGHQSELAFFILPTHSGVTLQIRQGDFANFPDPEKIFHECLQGWRTVSKDLIATCLQAP